jgi:hypothetical protein
LAEDERLGKLVERQQVPLVVAPRMAAELHNNLVAVPIGVSQNDGKLCTLNVECSRSLRCMLVVVGSRAAYCIVRMMHMQRAVWMDGFELDTSLRKELVITLRRAAIYTQSPRWRYREGIILI